MPIYWKRELVWRQERQIGRARYDPLASWGRLGTVQPLVPDGMADPLAQKAKWANKDVIRFMRWSIMPIAKVTRGRCTALVAFGDARFGPVAGTGPMAQTVIIPMNGPGCAMP